MSEQKGKTMTDLIERQAAIDMIEAGRLTKLIDAETAINGLKALPPAQLESTRKFVKLVVEYPDPELCTYKEYKGKPYYSIKYIENGETYVGYGTYNPEVLSQYLKEYFMPPAQPEIIRCKDCKYFELDHFEKVDWSPIPIIVAHEICMKWGEGCKSNIDGWCFMAERKIDG